MNKTLLITGSTGFLGSLFLKSYQNKNVEVFLVGRDNKTISSKYEQYSLSSLKKESLLDKNELYVLHLATHYSKELLDNSKIKSANLDFGEDLLSLISGKNLINFLYTNTMFAFINQEKNHYYTKTKIEFSKILSDYLDPNNISEVFLDNSFHQSDKRNKIIPIIINSILNNKKNPIENKNNYLNLTYAPDVINCLTKELFLSSKHSSRVTSSMDVNISSIYEFLKYFFETGKVSDTILQFVDAEYNQIKSLPTLNNNFVETNIALNLIKTIKEVKKTRV